MGLTREFIREMVDCPECGAAKGQPCRANGRNHFDRMHKAQLAYPEEAGDYKPKGSFDGARMDELKQGRLTILDVGCPVCKQGVGIPCVTYKNENMQGFHLPRVKSVELELSPRSLKFYSYGKLSKED
jgi:hypothetical protein